MCVRARVCGGERAQCAFWQELDGVCVYFCLSVCLSVSVCASVYLSVYICTIGVCLVAVLNVLIHTGPVLYKHPGMRSCE